MCDLSFIAANTSVSLRTAANIDWFRLLTTVVHGKVRPLALVGVSCVYRVVRRQVFSLGFKNRSNEYILKYRREQRQHTRVSQIKHKRKYQVGTEER